MTTLHGQYGEIRDAVHGFVRLERDERTLLDSPFLQRLRDVHQLALSYLVYPGATHKRFEHSLGVMELAGRAYDVITDRRRQGNPSILERYGLDDDGFRLYWRKVVRMAGLCHDIGHLPFSHAAEDTVLPPGTSHENITAALILSEEMSPFWEGMTPPLRPLDVAKVAVGKKFLPDEDFRPLERILHDIIGHDGLGADRMDYLLRDSRHAGVAYGVFDHLRLLDTMRILAGTAPDAPADELGIEYGGLYAAESLFLARYFMFMQVYYHPVRRAYDLHLQDFMGSWLGELEWPVKWEVLRSLTDSEALLAMREAEGVKDSLGQDPARRILHRDHFRRIVTVTPAQGEQGEDKFESARQALEDRLEPGDVKIHPGSRRDRPVIEFPVKMEDGSSESPANLSETYSRLPIADVRYIFVDRHYVDAAWQILRDIGVS